MPPPRAISCEVCGKQFFKRSYGIHLKQCKKTRATAYSKCKKCNLPVSNDEYSDHFLNCKQPSLKKRVVKLESKLADVELQDIHNRTRDDTGRISCQVCKRHFAEDRVAKHEIICLKNNKKKKRKKYPSSSKCRLKGTVFEKFTRRRVVKPIKQRDWKKEHEAVKAGVGQGLLIAEFKRQNIPLSELPNVSQNVDSLRPQDYSPKVQKIIEKVMKFRVKCDYFETKEASNFKVGERVLVKKRKMLAEIKYIGRVPELFNGYWLGIELLEGKGCNNGIAGKRKYFDCKSGMGIFIRPSKVVKLSNIVLWSSREEGKAKCENDVCMRKQPLSARFRSKIRSVAFEDELCENDVQRANKIPRPIR